MIDIDKARMVFMLTTLDPNFPPPYSDMLMQQAGELNLVIEAMDWTAGMYFGEVVEQDDQGWLIKIGSGRAGVLSFCEIEEGTVIPRIGDKILLTFTRGIVHVVVLQSPKNAHVDANRLE